MSEHTKPPWRHVWKHDTHKVKRDKSGRILGPVIVPFEDYQHAVECVNKHDALLEYKEACEKFVAFLGTLNSGWLGKTTGDVGLLNEAYIQEARAKASLAAVKNGGVQ